MGLANTLSRLSLPPSSWLFHPIRILPWEIRNKPLELALNHAFQQPLEEDEFDALEGRWLKVTVSDLQLDFYVTVSDRKMVMSGPRSCDVTFRGESTSFLTLATRQEDPDTLFFNRKLAIEGDTELGLGVKNMLDSLELDQLPKALQWAVNRTEEFQQLWKTHSPLAKTSD
ncbi:SCP2 sterol-binding domain-containing protein [Parendozoicomonas sp. Alg238-R29]|uniref:ubiquinone anaerobic biosynthesis accessory factor UbiT n=1 Tax=Parendozoicomonas sp. Alg238-R29 TaxID=2993446 RepID=UPI00248D77E1|nr:SCP2 sterol-binding domain-containing protein [Parendozoicomonas sp. Alg238-R29]